MTCPANAPWCCWQRCWDICPLQHTHPWRDAFVFPLSDLNLPCRTSWGRAEKPGQMFQFPRTHSFDCIRLDRISPLALPRGNVKWVMNIIHSAVYISDAEKALIGSSGISRLKNLICLDMTQLWKITWLFVCTKAWEICFLVERSRWLREPGVICPGGKSWMGRQLSVV